MQNIKDLREQNIYTVDIWITIDFAQETQWLNGTCCNGVRYRCVTGVYVTDFALNCITYIDHLDYLYQLYVIAVTKL